MSNACILPPLPPCTKQARSAKASMITSHSALFPAGPCSPHSSRQGPAVPTTSRRCVLPLQVWTVQSQPLTSRHLFTSSMVALLQSLGMAKIPIPEKTRRQREKHVHSWLMILSGTHTETPKLKNQYFFMGIVPLCCSASATLYI